MCLLNRRRWLINDAQSTGSNTNLPADPLEPDVRVDWPGLKNTLPESVPNK